MTRSALATMATLLALVAMGAALFVHALVVPWLLAALIFLANYALSLLFLQAISRLKTSVAAGVAVLSFLMRFGLIGLGLLTVALALPDYLLATAICFLVVYTAFLALEIAVNLRARGVASSGGEA